LAPTSDNLTTLNKSLTKQMGLLFLGKSLSFIFTFFIPLVLVRTFSIEEFGLYKQIFLISGTLMIFLSFGLEPSLYYFIPKSLEYKNIYISQTIIFYVLIGCIAFLLSFVFDERVAYLVNNPEISKVFSLITLYTVLMLISRPIESIMVSLKQAQQASMVIFSTEVIKAMLITGTALFIGTINSILYAVIILGIGRLLLLTIYLYRGLNFSFSRLRLKYLQPQFSFAIPFAFASISRSFSDIIPFYIVSHLYSVTSFAIYSVGLLQLPLIQVFASSIRSVSMVRITEFAKHKDIKNMNYVISDAVKKIAIIFIPIFAFLIINAREFIITLYTIKFQESIPIFMISILILPIFVLDLNYVLRSLGETKFLLIANIIRLLLTIFLVFVGLSYFDLAGAATGVIISLAIPKFIILLKVIKKMGANIEQILPLKELVKVVAYTSIVSGMTFIFKLLVDLETTSMLVCTFILFASFYLLLIYKSEFVSQEKEVFHMFLRKLLTFNAITK
jgi:O-antigen/teichoic acid export membrane protein